MPNLYAGDPVGGDALESPARLSPVIFVVTQTGMRDNGGVESVTQVIERLRRVRPVVVTQLETPTTQRWRDAGCRVLVWPAPLTEKSTGLSGRVSAKVRLARAMIENNRRMYRLVRSEGCRVVHCNDILSLWLTGFGARRAGARVVFNIRNVKPEGQHYGLRWKVARRLSTRQLVLSREMRDALARRLGAASKAAQGASGIEYIYSIIDPLRYRPPSRAEREEMRARLGISKDCFAIGYVAAFGERKAQLDFIARAAPSLREMEPSSRVYFLGDFNVEESGYERRCFEIVKNLGLGDAVSFVGHVSNVWEWYRALDLVVVASRNEGLARCMIESLACGTPVVSFDVCSAREILEEGGCGVVVSQGDFGSLVEQLTALARTDRVRQEMGSRGIQIARKLFDPPTVVRRYEELYLSIMEV